ncbi:MAG TPA: HAMP domain-containing sensor histidine kinase [Sediminibacterium sp.]|nr:HAMP domain-containing sensor histidine kinase [Sediminibacterium sp.]
MNLKLRFALLFTSFVSLILLLSCLSTYFLFSNSRQDDYFRRLSKEGSEVYNIYTDVKQRDPSIVYRLIREVHDKTLYNEALYILDGTGMPLFKFPDTLTLPKNQPLLRKIRNDQEYQRQDVNGYQEVALYMPETNAYVFISGLDKQGFLKLSNLKLILVFVFLGALLLSAVISFFFVQAAVSPLKDLSAQMKRTDVQNLLERVPETAARDEINEIARSFNAMLERLNKSFEFQKNFVYHASHELRTPLATMLSQTESALNRELSIQEYRSTLHFLQEEQQEMIELTNSLLLISQFQHIDSAEEWPELRVDEVIYETISLCKKQFPDLVVHVAFSRLPDNDNDFIIRGNETLLRSAFSNLIKNAYTYSVNQVLHITMDTDESSVFIHFDNKGMQLPAEERESMMAPFFRGRNAVTSKGYGLGLSIVYRFISVHKGAVNYQVIDTDLNRFTVTLPKARRESTGTGESA